MLPKFFAKAGMSLFLACAICVFSFAKANEKLESTSAALDGLRSSDLVDRIRAFHALVDPLEEHPPDTSSFKPEAILQPELRRGLIDLLYKEQLVYPRTVGDDDGEFWIDLTGAVSALHDPEALGVLLRPTVLKYGYATVPAIASFGQPIVPRLLDIYNSSKDQDYRWHIEEVFLDMLRNNAVTDARPQSNLRALFLLETYSRLDSIRSIAIAALSHLQSPKVVARIKQLEETDPFWVGTSDKRFYPVRSVAEEALARGPL